MTIRTLRLDVRRGRRRRPSGSWFESPMVAVAAAIVTMAALVLLTLHAPEDTAPRSTRTSGAVHSTG